jgi:hypothetical protein
MNRINQRMNMTQFDEYNVHDDLENFHVEYSFHDKKHIELEDDLVD